GVPPLRASPADLPDERRAGGESPGRAGVSRRLREVHAEAEGRSAAVLRPPLAAGAQDPQGALSAAERRHPLHRPSGGSLLTAGNRSVIPRRLSSPLCLHNWK